MQSHFFVLSTQNAIFQDGRHKANFKQYVVVVVVVFI